MSTMTDREIIAWAKHVADVYTNEPDLSLSTRYRRLADLAQKGAEDWQPIATAPMVPIAEHGPRTDYLLFDGDNNQEVVAYWDDAWTSSETGEVIAGATLWRPLPTPPGGER